jgi:hypothetical protein
MIKKSFISVKKNSVKKNSAHGRGQPTACGHIGPESPVLGFAIVVEKLLSSFSRWMGNEGHRAWDKSPVTFVHQVRESPVLGLYQFVSTGLKQWWSAHLF